MADFGQPVAAGIQGPQAGLQTLSGLLGLKQQQLGIARQQIGLSQAQQQLSQETSQATQAQIHTANLQNLQGVDWKQYQTPNGYDIQAAQQKALEVGGADAAPFVSRLADMTTAGTGAKKALFSLSQDYQKPLRNTMALWAQDPKGKLSDLGAQLEADIGTFPKSAQANASQLVNSTLRLIAGGDLFTGRQKTLDQQKAQALMFARAGLAEGEVSGPGGLATPIPGVQSSGTQLIPTSTSRTNPSQVTKGTPITDESVEATLPNGQKVIINLAKGTAQPVGSGGVSTSGGGNGEAPQGPAITAENDPNRPGANAPVQMQQQWTQALGQANKDVSAARDADQYGNNMSIAQEVRSLSHATNTGPGTPEWTRLVGTISSRFGGSQGVTNTQTLESFLDRQAASMRGAMGLPATNLGAEESKVIGGNIGMQGGALRAKNDYNEALAQGLHDYRQGLDKIAGFGGNASPTEVNRFRSEWAKYFNPIAYEYRLAQQRGDRNLQDAIAKSVSPSQAKRMMADLEITERLVKGLPP